MEVFVIYQYFHSNFSGIFIDNMIIIGYLTVIVLWRQIYELIFVIHGSPPIVFGIDES